MIEVTNTNDSGAGSLRACVMATGPRTCIFRVAGLFLITSGDLRFSGQPTIPQPAADRQDAAVVNGTPCVESLHDGIPDQWKKSNGLSTSDPNLYKTVDAKTGYTYLEEYLAGNATPVTPPPPAATASASGTIVTPASGATIADAQANT